MKPLPVQFLRESGLLFEVNRAVLHPLGLSLQVGVDGSVELLQTSDPAGIVFSDVAFHEGETLLRAYMEREGESRILARRAFLQYVQQTDADQGDSSGSVG